MNDNKIIPFNSDIPANDGRPLPLIVAEQWHFPLAHHSVEGVYYYSAADWIRGLVQVSDARHIWQDVSNSLGDQLLDSTLQLPYIASNGKPYSMAHCTDFGLYLVAQAMRVTKKRPILAKIQEYLANAGVFVDRARLDPEQFELVLQQQRINRFKALGHGEKWALVRDLSVHTRKELTAELLRVLGEEQMRKGGAGAVTNEIYRGVFKTDAEGLKDRLSPSDGKRITNPRDHMKTLQLAYLIEAEAACSIELEQFDDDELIPLFIVKNLVSGIANIVGIKAQEMANRLKIDLVTGQRLLPDGSKPNNTPDGIA